MNIKAFLAKTALKVKKHSPAIYITLGVVGVGYTVYEAYKSRPKVEAVVERVEDARAHDEPIDKIEVVKDVAVAVWKPVVVGTASIGLILWAHKIQANRIKFLMGALVTEQARNIYFQQKYRREHGEEAYERFVTPIDRIEHTTTDAKGKEKLTVEQVKRDVDKSIGQWFSDSSEYVADDHTYNIAFIDAIDDKMNTLLFQRGNLLLNEVREALGFERTRSGQLLGWSSGMHFNIQKMVHNVGNVEAGESLEQIYVTWSNPKYIYEEIEFNGRYNPFGE